MTDLNSNFDENINPIDGEKINQLKSNLLSKNFDSSSITRILTSSKANDIETSKEIMKQFDFKGQEFVEALRIFVTKVDLPGEGPQLIIFGNHFCERYMACNTVSYTCEQYRTLIAAIFLLSKSFTQPTERMPLKVFTSRAFEASEIDKPYLTQIYYSIKTQPLFALKRKPKISINFESVAKKPKTVIFQHFGSSFLSRKVLKSRSILNKTLTWKKFFASLDNLSLSLYKYNDVMKYIESTGERCSSLHRMNDPKFATFIKNQKAVDVMDINHCLAKPITDHDKRFLLYLNDGSKYCFKVSQSTQVEFWESTINYTAALLSFPRSLNMNNDVLQYGVSIFPQGITTLNMTDQLKYLCSDCQQLKNQMQHIEDLIEKPEDYKFKLKHVQYQIDRFETYIRHLKVTMQQKQCEPGCSLDDRILDHEIDSLNTYGSIGGMSDSSKGGKHLITIESRSRRPQIGSPSLGPSNKEEKPLSYSSDSDL